MSGTPSCQIGETGLFVEGMTVLELFYPDQTELHSVEKQIELIYDGKVYVTSYLLEGRFYGGRVIADSWERAEEIAAFRNMGETVMGQLASIERFE